MPTTAFGAGVAQWAGRVVQWLEDCLFKSWLSCMISVFVSYLFASSPAAHCIQRMSSL